MEPSLLGKNLGAISSSKLPSISLVGGLDRSVQTRFSLLDLLVYGMILLLGVFQSTHYLHTPSLVTDPTYPDLARSLLEKHSYQIRFLPQTMLPPGFPMILAVVGFFAGFSPATMFPIVAISEMLGLFVAYELLKVIEGRALAAAACLLFAFSPELFGFNSYVVLPEMTYVLTSFLALYMAIKIDHATPGLALIGRILILGSALAMAVLIRSVGVALIMAMGAWIVASYFNSRYLGRRRLLLFSFPLLLAASAQFAWSVWAHSHEILEWELPGYPRPYLSQISVKDGQHPELGVAQLGDIPKRVSRNLVISSATMTQFIMRRYVSRFWASPATIGVLLLLSVGLVSSLHQAANLHDWYFICYQLVFIFWPWDYKTRFLIPIFPLACLYLWRGMKQVVLSIRSQPERLGFAMILVGMPLSILSFAFSAGRIAWQLNPDHVFADRFQPLAASCFWLILAAAGFVIIRSRGFRELASIPPPLTRYYRFAEERGPVILRMAGIAIIATLILSGASRIYGLGRRNLTVNVSQLPDAPMIEAADWIRTHQPSESIVMAREPEFISHFTRGHVVWFPPISDPATLMEGIRRMHVDLIIVVHNEVSYWQPPEDLCFHVLQSAYPRTFRLIQHGEKNWIYQVLPPLRTTNSSANSWASEGVLLPIRASNQIRLQSDTRWPEPAILRQTK